MSEEWTKAGASEHGTTIRWAEEPRSEWEKENTEFKGATIQGVYEQRHDNVGMNQGVMYKINTTEHGMLTIWGTTVLNDKMADVPVNSEVKIEFQGYQKPKKNPSGKPYATFNVFHRPAPMQEVKPSVEPELPPV